ncbi:MAG: type II toxin-antitoxin system HicB family antitoxin [Bermanella sp.]
MLFMVGIETPSNDNEAWGMVVPAFNEVGYGCTSASDEEKNIVSNVKDAILSMVEVILDDGIDIKKLDQGYKNYTKEKEYRDFETWVAVDVNLDELKGKRQRVNITINDVLLTRIDGVVKSGNYKDRSAFLENAARHELEHA